MAISTIRFTSCGYAGNDNPLIKKHRQTYKQVADVANGAYDWKIERTINEV